MTTIAKRDRAGEEDRPNTWRPLYKSSIAPHSKNSATYVCPNGHIGTLSDHTIQPDGTMSDSVVCPTPGCGFHDMVQLEGWTA